MADFSGFTFKATGDDDDAGIAADSGSLNLFGSPGNSVTNETPTGGYGAGSALDAAIDRAVNRAVEGSELASGAGDGGANGVGGDDDDDTGDHTWEYLDNHGWAHFDGDTARKVESVLQAGLTVATVSPNVGSFLAFFPPFALAVSYSRSKLDTNASPLPPPLHRYSRHLQGAPGTYVIDFRRKVQTNARTGYERRVRRDGDESGDNIVVDPEADAHMEALGLAPGGGLPGCPLVGSGTTASSIFGGGADTSGLPDRMELLSGFKDMLKAIKRVKAEQSELDPDADDYQDRRRALRAEQVRLMEALRQRKLVKRKVRNLQGGGGGGGGGFTRSLAGFKYGGGGGGGVGGHYTVPADWELMGVLRYDLDRNGNEKRDQAVRWNVAEILLD